MESNDEKNMMIFENFFSREENMVYNPFYKKKWVQLLKILNIVLIIIIKHLLNLSIWWIVKLQILLPWSPYAINTYKDYIKRGDNLKLNQLLQDTRIKIQEAADARLNYNVA